MKKTWRELLSNANLEHADYDTQYEYIQKLISEKKVFPILSSGSNGRKKSLCVEYKINNEKSDLSFLMDELNYQIHPNINIEYYINHLETYLDERYYVKKLSDFFHNHIDLLNACISRNERCFQIWQDEKFLDDPNENSNQKSSKKVSGKTILKHCKISEDKLNYYATVEPLSYYSKKNTVPQTVLIIENKDTFYSMCKFLLSGQTDIFGFQIGTLIYGAGKRILKSFSLLNIISENYMLDSRNTFLYFGDIDYEGIFIYERLIEMRQDIVIKPFLAAYCKMIEKGSELDLPKSKEKQNKKITNEFFKYFDAEYVNAMLEILKDGRYIPQEILNINDF